MATVAPDISPADLLGRLRGTIVEAAPGYPEVIHLGVRDDLGGEWSFSTFHAEYQPPAATDLLGKTVTEVIQHDDGELTMTFSDGTRFAVRPAPTDADGSGQGLAIWQLITPEGLSLWYGPRGRWQLSRASDPY